MNKELKCFFSLINDRERHFSRAILGKWTVQITNTTRLKVKNASSRIKPSTPHTAKKA
jgi:hypothetical protein